MNPQARAYVQFDYASFGVKIALTPTENSLRLWGESKLVATEHDAATSPAEPGFSEFLRLREDEARALYEALADHFGHAGHDIRALRKDYDAERGRVDKLINNLIGQVR